MSINVRECKLEDIDGVIEVLETCGMIDEDDRQWLVNRVKEEDGKQKIMIAEKEGKIISTTIIDLRSRLFAHIPVVGTHSDYRRQGGARNTLDAALAEAKKANMAVVGLGTGIDNVAAQNLYHQAGFIPGHPQYTYLLNFLNIPIIDELKAKRPFLSPRPEAEEKIGDMDCVRMGWYDPVSHEQLTFHLSSVFRDNMTALAVMKVQIQSSILELDLNASIYSSGFVMCQGSPVEVGMDIENLSDKEFEYKIKPQLPESLSESIKIEEQEVGKVESNGKASYRLNFKVPDDAKIGVIPLCFGINEMFFLSTALDVREPLERTVSPRWLALSPGDPIPIMLDISSNHPEPYEMKYSLSYPENWNVESDVRTVSKVKQGDRIVFNPSVSVPSDAESGDYEIGVKVSHKGKEIIKLRVADYRVLFLAKDEYTEPVIKSIMTDERVGITWLTMREVNTLQWFETLNNYAVLVLDELGPTRPLSFEQMYGIREFVRNGGGFVMFGGWYNFQGKDNENCGFYDGTPLEEILPVDISSDWDAYDTFSTREQRKIEPFKLKCVDPKHPITKGVNWENIPEIRGFNKCESVKRRGKVLLTKDETDEPILVVGEYGEGRTMAFLTCFTRGWSSSLNQWEGFNQLSQNMIQWLARLI